MFLADISPEELFNMFFGGGFPSCKYPYINFIKHENITSNIVIAVLLFKSKLVYVIDNVLYTVQKLTVMIFFRVANVYAHHTHSRRQHRHYHPRENVSNDVSILLLKLKILIIVSDMLMYYMYIIFLCLITV